MTTRLPSDPAERMAEAKREFGEWGGVNASVEASCTFSVLHADTLPAIFQGELTPDKGGCYLYGRSYNPTVRHLGRQLAAMEGTEAAYCCASGMAAISASLLAVCRAGDAIVASDAVYGGTHALLKTFLPSRCGITTTFVDITDLAAVAAAAALSPRTRAIFTETLSNPTLRLADVPALAELARAAGATLIVDNTFTPMVLSPALLGADVVVHSLTKFVSGASDVMAGAICARAAFIHSLMDLHEGPLMLLGPAMDPHVAATLSLRLPHLGLRVAEHSRRAQLFAERLHAMGAAVTYPGLPSHPQHALMQRLANPGYGAGGLLTLDFPSFDAAKCFMERLAHKHGFGLMAVSLGYFDTLMSASAASTSSELTTMELEGAGISAGLVRMSVGLTGSAEQRWTQLEESYRSVARKPATAKPGYKAARLGRDSSTGRIVRSPSWLSFGSELSDATDADPGPAAGEEPGAAPHNQDARVLRINTDEEVVYRALPSLGHDVAPLP